MHYFIYELINNIDKVKHYPLLSTAATECRNLDTFPATPVEPPKEQYNKDQLKLIAEIGSSA